MSESVAATATSAASPTVAAPVGEKKLKKVAVTKVKKASVSPTHPPTQQMVDASIKTLKERGGSSLMAIKKYISATYKCDAQKLAPFIKKYLKSAVASGKLIQTKGTGASGSFKLSASASAKKNFEKEVKTAKKGSSASKKSAVVPGKKGKAATVEKKMKKAVAAKSATTIGSKKNSEKKKAEKAKIKAVKKTGTVKAKPGKATKAAVSKPKAPKAKSTVPKPKKVVSAAPKKITSGKKPAAKK